MKNIQENPCLKNATMPKKWGEQRLFRSFGVQVSNTWHNLISTRNFLRAFQLVKDTDRNDLIFVALTFEVGGKLWTSDLELKNGLRAGGFDGFYET